MKSLESNAEYEPGKPVNLAERDEENVMVISHVANASHIPIIASI